MGSTASNSGALAGAALQPTECLSEASTGLRYTLRSRATYSSRASQPGSCWGRTYAPGPPLGPLPEYERPHHFDSGTSNASTSSRRWFVDPRCAETAGNDGQVYLADAKGLQWQIHSLPLLAPGCNHVLCLTNSEVLQWTTAIVLSSHHLMLPNLQAVQV